MKRSIAIAAVASALTLAGSAQAQYYNIYRYEVEKLVIHPCAVAHAAMSMPIFNRESLVQKHFNDYSSHVKRSMRHLFSSYDATWNQRKTVYMNELQNCLRRVLSSHPSPQLPDIMFNAELILPHPVEVNQTAASMSGRNSPLPQGYTITRAAMLTDGEQPFGVDLFVRPESGYDDSLPGSTPDFDGQMRAAIQMEHFEFVEQACTEISAVGQVLEDDWQVGHIGRTLKRAKEDVKLKNREMYLRSANFIIEQIRRNPWAWEEFHDPMGWIVRKAFYQSKLESCISKLAGSW